MEEKLSHWERRVINLMKKHGPLIEEHRDGDTLYFVEGFGQVGGKAPKSLIDRKIVKPASDALLEGHSQTYVAA
jgi:hypothetical protein